MISIGKRIKQGRAKLGLSQEQLAAIMEKKGKGTISNWETDKNEPSIAEFKKLAELFSTTAAYLIGEAPQFEEPRENYVMVKKDDLIELLDAYGYSDTIIVSSFDHDFLKRFGAKTSAYKTGLLINGLLLDLPAYASEVGTCAWHPQFVNLRADQVKVAKQAGIEVNVWTLNEASEWISAVRMGVDGIVTDDPEGLRAFLDKLKSIQKHLGKPKRRKGKG